MYLTLFKTFFKLGIATFWGGYTMLSKIEDDVVRRHQWMSQQEFTDLLALVQTCPGVFFINMSTFIGYKIKEDSRRYLHHFRSCFAVISHHTSYSQRSSISFKTIRLLRQSLRVFDLLLWP